MLYLTKVSIVHCRTHCRRFCIRSWRVWQYTKKLSSNTTSYEKITFLVLGTYTRYPFWFCAIPTKMPRNHFCAWWRMFNVFVSTCAVAFRTTYGQNKTHKCDTEGFVPVASFYVVIRSPSSFIRSFIGRTVKYDLLYTLIQNEHILPEL